MADKFVTYFDWIQNCITEVCSEPCQASKIGLFAKIVNAKEFGDSSNCIDLWMLKNVNYGVLKYFGNSYPFGN